MEAARLFEIMEELESRFAPAKVNQKAMECVWLELLEVHPGAYELAKKRLLIETNQMPTVDRIKSVLQSEGKKAQDAESIRREKEWGKTKGGQTPDEIRRAGSIFSREMQDDHAKHAVQAIKLMMSPATRADKLDCFREMEKSYPGVGWAKQGMRLKAFWEDGRPLTMPGD